ncbi:MULTISPECIES: ATP-binding protein [Actinoplanes]|uniref:ATP-binding protein n=1 Tax=Actinoplanes TaxID=1865 RepID=UPI000697FABB|nr:MULTISPECIES: ATP-binding protein [Actinoplanes]GLX99845.1 hypothetical protein Acsp01_02250 [Actinoplanes sp. NBRC 101535]
MAAPQLWELVLPADHASLRRLGPWLADLMGPVRPDDVPKLVSRIELALHEVCVNVVDHAYNGAPGTVTITGRADGDYVVLRITDLGVPFERSSVVAPQPGVPQIRGYGLMIVDQLADGVAFERDGDLNICELRFRRTRPETP